MSSETKVISIIVLITIVIIGAGLFLASGNGRIGEPPVALTSEALVRDYSPRQKGQNAQIQIVEFADFECPSCAAFHPTFKKFKQEYGDRLDFVLRIIPIHRNSKSSSAAAYAAGEQGKYFEMHDMLFEKQGEWAKVGANVNAFYEKYAGEIGLDITKFKSDLASKMKEYDDRVDQDALDANTMNINSTPTLVINGNTVVRGGLTYENLKKLVDETIAASSGTSTATSTATSSAR
jgi:protein-disulfide isomerase